MIQSVEIILTVVLIYLSVGIVFAIPFVIFGARRIDDAATKTSILFKILIFPASAIFWPFLLLRWIKSRKNKNDITA